MDREITDKEIVFISQMEALKADVTRIRDVKGLTEKALSRSESLADEGLRDLVQAMLLEAASLCERAAGAKVKQVRAMKIEAMEESAEYFDDKRGGKGTQRSNR